MKWGQTLDKSSLMEPFPSEVELLTLFHQDTARAWGLFIERYADAMLSFAPFGI
jgi:hypothetical protein